MSAKIDHVLIDSSMVDTISYYHDSSKLIVAFKNGRVYVYKDVDKKTFESIRKSDSTGKALHKKVFKIFKYSEL